MKPYLFMKRLFDFTGALLLLALLGFLLVIIAAAVLVFSGRPALFRQIRAGREGKPFTMYKFRTMKNIGSGDADFTTNNISIPGAFLRRSGLDELPQLFNILRGEMSFIGPRPLLCEYLPLYTARQARRQELLPGITGWSQVNGRNAITWEKRLNLDCWYVEHVSLRVDCRILFCTVKCLFHATGVNHSSSLTMPSFQATKDASLLILGAGGHGRVVADAAKETCLYKRIAFLDDALPAGNSGGYKILGRFEDYPLFSGSFANAVVAIGNNKARLHLLRRLEEAGYILPVIVHPRAFVSVGASIGNGTVVLTGAVIVTGARLGAGCIINTLASVDHDCLLGDGVHICPGAHLAGTVRVGDLTTVFTSAGVANNICIGAQTVIASGAAVVCDIPSSVMAAGVPAIVKKTIGGE